MKFETVEREREYLCGLQEGERVIETGNSMMTGWQGTTVMGSRGMCVKWDNLIDGGQMTTSVTHGTRRIHESTQNTETEFQKLSHWL